MGISNTQGITEIPINQTTFAGGSAGGTAQALTLTISGFQLGLATMVTFLPSITSIGPGVTTVSINGGSAIPIKKVSAVGLVDISDGDFFPGVAIILSYDGAEWVALNVVYVGTWSNQAIGYTLSLADLFNSVNATSAMTITLSSATAYGNYFYCNIFATNGDVTLAPNGTDTIQGLNASFIIKNGTSVRLYTDGISAWRMNGTGAGPLWQVVASGRFAAQVAAKASVAAYTVGAADQSLIVQANVLVTTATTHSFTTTVAYTDEGNTSRTLTLNYQNLAGTISPTIANAGGAVPYMGLPVQIRCKAATTVTVATVGTFTTVTYNVESEITRIA